MVRELEDLVCSQCGIVTGVARSTGLLIHTGDLPENTPFHEAVGAIPRGMYDQYRSPMATLVRASVDMLKHHATLHPETECEWSLRLMKAIPRK